MLNYVFLIHLGLRILHMVSLQEVPNEWIIEIYNLEDLKKILIKVQKLKKYFNKNTQLNRHIIVSKLYLIQVM